MAQIKYGACHCGSIEFEVVLESELREGARCNCSLCVRKGAVFALAPRQNIKILKGKDKLTLYQWNSNLAEHYFCCICGIYTHHYRRTDPNGAGFNVACLKDVDPYAIDEIAVIDGASLSLVS